MSTTPTREWQGTELAIVGMAGRFPGVQSLEEFWRAIDEGRELIRAVSDEELRAAGVHEAQLRDSHYVRAAAVLDQVGEWDAPFWGFSPHEARLMDPQHRLFMECAWEALEHAGHAPEQFAGAIGVFGGCGMQAYMANHLLPNRALMERDGLFLVRHTGNDKDFLSTRVSYELNLRGPSVNVQTACSTSLVAVHTAAQSLLNGECDMALAGGVTIELPHAVGYLWKENEILSPDGHCRPFDAEAQGTVFGSGAGVVVLRRLADALRDGDHVHAVILGSAINNDGSQKVGYLAPSVDGQRAAIEEALAIAGVSANDISLVEAHGTGTPVGDPIEVAALTEAYRLHSSRTGYCRLGSLKSNIGHLDTAAGVAALIKTVLAMQHRRLPGTVHFTAPNPALQLHASPFTVSAHSTEWSGATRRIAGVSSLGVGGTNAHVVVEEAPPAAAHPRPSRAFQLFPLSAACDASLHRMTENLADHLHAHPDASAADAAFTLSRGRQALRHRRCVVAPDVATARALLDADGAGNAIAGQADANATAAFLFAGGGAQYPGMGAALYASEPVYRDVVDQCLAVLDPDVRSAVRAALCEPAPEGELPAEATAQLERPELALPALFAAQLAMARLLESWGIVPQAMIGHSMGEYTAACLAGVFSTEDAMRLVALRGVLFARLPDGAMLSVPLSEMALRARLAEPAFSALSVAVVNGPELCVASGPRGAVKALEESLAAEGVESRLLHISVAAHSAMLDPILAEFEAGCRTVAMSPPTRDFVSNETGTWIAAEQATSPEYWVRHLRNTVRFSDGLAALLKEPSRVLVEVGPGRVLTSLARQHPDRRPEQLLVTSMCAPGEAGNDVAAALTALAQLWSRGVAVDWEAFWRGQERRRIVLPTYAWERQRYWIDAPNGAAASAPVTTERRSDTAHWYARHRWLPAPLRAAAVSDHALPVTSSVGSAASADSPGAYGAAHAQGTRVLVFVDHTPLGHDIISALTAQGAECIVVRDGEDYRREGSSVQLPLAGDTQHARLLSELAANGELPDRLVCAVAGEAGFRTLMAFAGALASEDLTAPLAVTTITNGVPLFGDAAGTDALAALPFGPARTFPREFDNVRSRIIDAPAPAHSAARRRLAEAVVRDLLSDDHTELVAYRGAERFAPELAPVTIEPAALPPLRERGTYLITGGLGGIGFALAEELARTYKARLALVGRGATMARAAARVAALEALGAEVELVQADITSQEQLAAGLARVEARFGAVHGVFHAAGVLDDGLMAGRTPDAMRRVLAPKVQGTLVLDAVLGERALDCFVLFSSVSAEAGLPGQADYAAACAFQNAFAQARTARTGEHTVAVSFSAWRDVGMAHRQAQPEHLRRGVGEVVHPLLGTRLHAHDSRELYGATFSADSHWALREHRLRTGDALLPGTAYLEIARAAVDAHPSALPVELCDVSFLSPFMAPADASRELRVSVVPQANGRSQLCIAGAVALDDGTTAWQEHVTARVGRTDAAPPPVVELADVRARCATAVRVVDGGTNHPHLEFGARWRNLLELHTGPGEALAELALPPEYRHEMQEYALHPALMDLATACGCVLSPAFNAERDFFVPLSYTRLTHFAPLTERVLSHVQLVSGGHDANELLVFNIRITDPAGRVLVDIEEFLMTRVAGAAALAESGRRRAERRTTGRYDVPPLPPVVETETNALRDAIGTEEGVQALLGLLAQPVATQLFVTPVDVRALLPALRESAVPVARSRPAGGGATAGGALDIPEASRLPLNEIDAVLAAHPVVLHGLAMQRRNRPGELRLVAYVAFIAGEHATVSDIRRFLKSRLPAHLVPGTIVELDAMPRAADGSIDRDALPDPFGVADDHVAPRTQTEQALAAVWQDVLGLSRVGLHDNFFDIGGHSLLAVRAIARTDKVLGARLHQANMVLQTLEQLAAEVDRQRAAAAEAPAVADDEASSGLGRRLFNTLRGR